MAYEKQYRRPKLAKPVVAAEPKDEEIEEPEAKATPAVVVEKKQLVVGHKYFVTYSGPHTQLSISPGPGKVEQEIEYQVSEELYHSMKGLTDWTARIEEILEQK